MPEKYSFMAELIYPLQNLYAVDSQYLERSVSQTYQYLKQISWSIGHFSVLISVKVTFLSRTSIPWTSWIFLNQILVNLTKFLSLSRTFPQISNIIVLTEPNRSVICFKKNFDVLNFPRSTVFQPENSNAIMAKNSIVI